MFRGSGFDKLLGKLNNFINCSMLNQYYVYLSILDKATSHLLMEPDWPTIIQICDMIRQNDVQ